MIVENPKGWIPIYGASEAVDVKPAGDYFPRSLVSDGPSRLAFSFSRLIAS